MAEEEYNKGGYESMVWIRDKDGKEYACTAAALKGNLKTKEELTEEEKESCMDVSQLIGTERWQNRINISIEAKASFIL